MSVPTLPLSNEDQLNLSSSIVDVTEGNTRMTNGHNFVRLAGAEVPSQLAAIPFSALDTLYQEVTTYCSSAKDCLTALRVYFGASNDEESVKMKLFYEPLFLSYDSDDATTGERIYRVTQTGSLWSFNGTNFIAEKSTDLAAAKTIFQGEVTLKHTPTSASFEPFISGDDVESAVIPFQTIFALLNDNGNTSFDLKHCVDIENIGGVDKVKETFILNTTEISDNGAFAGKFANRAETDPPHSILYKYSV